MRLACTAEAILLMYLLDWLELISHHRLPLAMFWRPVVTPGSAVIGKVVPAFP